MLSFRCILKGEKKNINENKETFLSITVIEGSIVVISGIRLWAAVFFWLRCRFNKEGVISVY